MRACRRTPPGAARTSSCACCATPATARQPARAARARHREPAAVIYELELAGYEIDRVHRHGRLLGVRPAERRDAGRCRCVRP